MNLCDECQTAAHCLRNGCIPITEEPPKPSVNIADYIDPCPGCFPGGTCATPTCGRKRSRALMEAFGIPITNSPFRAEPPLKFPVIDESLLPTKETTA